MDEQIHQTGQPQQRPLLHLEGETGIIVRNLKSIIPILLSLISLVFLILITPSSSSIKSVIMSGMHQVPEGHVGVYYRGGALLRTISSPGFHMKMPMTRYEPIQVTLQTDQVTDVPCGTKGGIMINFERIEVVNRLNKEYVYETLLNYGIHYDKTWIYNKIHHEINQFCSSHSLQEVYIDMFDQIDDKMKDALQADCTFYAPGIEIFSVRITKPSIPESIRRNFEQMEEERTKVLIAIEKQHVAEKEAETKKKMAISEAEKNARVAEKEAETLKAQAISEAEKNAKVSQILMEQQLMEKDSHRKQQEIENHMYLARQKSLADADFYRKMKEAEANQLKLTPQYLELRFIESIANNTKIFFGDKVPNMVLDQRLLGNFLQNVHATKSNSDEATA